MNRKVYLNSEQIAFLENFIPGHWWKEIYSEFQKRFPHLNIEFEKLVTWCFRNLKARNGMDGHVKKGMHFSPATEFKKGQQPIYLVPKGTRLSPATEFKKGNQPHNTVPVGTEIMKSDGYIWIKVREQGLPGRPWRKWEQKHRLVWEAANGPVPEGSKITFISGNRYDCSLENLMLITDAQNAYLNHNDIRGVGRDALNIGLNLHKLAKVINDNKKNTKGKRSA